MSDSDKKLTSQRRLQYTAGEHGTQVTVDGTDFSVVPNGVLVRVHHEQYVFMPWHRVYKVSFHPNDLQMSNAIVCGSTPRDLVEKVHVKSDE